MKKKLFDDLGEKISDAIICFDEAGKIIYINKTLKTKLKYQKSEILKSSIFDFLHAQNQKKLTDYVKNMNQNENDFFTKLALTNKDEKIILLEGKFVGLFEKNKLIHVTAILKDVSEVTMLKREKMRLQNVIEGIDAGIWEYNFKSKELLLDNKCGAILGYLEQDIYPVDKRKWLKLVHPENRNDIINILNNPNQEKKNYQKEIRMKHSNGKWIWILVKCKLVMFEESSNPWMLGIIVDINQRKELEKQLYNEKEMFRTTLFSVGEGVIATDKKGIIILMNKMAEKLTGWKQAEAIGEHVNKIFNVFDEDLRNICENPIQTVVETGKNREISKNTILISKKGEEIPIEESIAPIKNSSGEITGAVIVFKDFTEYRQKQSQIEYLSFRDALTGLYNRRFMEDMLETMDKKDNLPLTIMILDVNGLKLTNDAFGHSVGDELLKMVAAIIKKVSRESDVVCRVGGDEFIIIFPKTDSKEAQKIKDRILKEASKQTLESIQLSIAVGYATKTKYVQDIENIKVMADNEMYKNKLKSGRVMRSNIIEKVIRSINMNYDQEQIHTERVAEYCAAIAIALGMSNSEVANIKNAAILHDIGKITIPKELLKKATKLTKEEFEIIKKHVDASYQMLKSVDEYANLAEFVLYHHERWDGKGYPYGLLAEEIPIESRIIAVADAYEAMTAKRPYQITKNKEEALAELKKHSGKQFDPKIVEIFLKMMNEKLN